MKTLELINISNFKHYRFVIYDKDIAEPRIVHQNGHVLDLYKPKDLPNHYDLGYSMKFDLFKARCVEHVAGFIDRSKLFKIIKLEYCNEKETLFIHLKLKG